MPTEAQFDNVFANAPAEEVLAQYALGNRLNVYTTLSGRQSYNYLPPPVLKPTFLIVEEYRLSSFLGQYGAGRTVKTFSLLPGEKTTISISSYKRSAATATSSSSILDSYTEDKADEFESTMMAEQTDKQSTSKNFEYHAEAEAHASWGWGGASASGGVSGGSTSAREQFASNAASTTEKQAASSSARRDMEVNTSSEVKTEEGEETSITREVKNINVGRTLNFTFRQMNQEFITLLHLVGVKVAFFNGYAESKEEVALSDVDRLLTKYIVEARRPAVKQAILDQARYVYDHRGTVQDVLEEVKPAHGGNTKYWRFKPNLVSTYEDSATGTATRVPGVIVAASKIVMRTDGLIVEALLGQADALDDYSKALQSERVAAQKLTNQRLALDVELERLRQEIVRNHDEAGARLYRTMYGQVNPEPAPGAGESGQDASTAD